MHARYWSLCLPAPSLPPGRKCLLATDRRTNNQAPGSVVMTLASMKAAKAVTVLQLMAVALAAASIIAPERPAGLRSAIEQLDRKWLRQLPAVGRRLESATSGGAQSITFRDRILVASLSCLGGSSCGRQPFDDLPPIRGTDKLHEPSGCRRVLPPLHGIKYRGALDVRAFEDQRLHIACTG
jgi:hypothetical protein